jgi:hypothetical protein
MEVIPLSIQLLFAGSAILSLVLFWRAAHFSKPVLYSLLFWLGLQSALGSKGFYLETDTFPPKIGLMVIPPFLAMLLLFILPQGRSFLNGLDKRFLVLVHMVRIPVEIGLYGLFLKQLVPQNMTFEGGNFDILSGISALAIYWFGYKTKALDQKWLIAWNLICLGLLFNVVGKGILSAPSVFQQLSFDQPNRAVLYFPVNLLPALIVPLVLFSHLALLRRK